MAKDAERRPIRRALISVYDKTGLVELAESLGAAGVEIVSTGSTAATIRAAGQAVTEVADLTGFPECLDGRVKTLHPRVHAGILADTRKSQHLAELQRLGVKPFDLVVVNLYPFSETVATGANEDECIEKIDIGGPSMVRAAAKNHASVAVITSPTAYQAVISALPRGGFTLAERQELAREAFQHTAAYDVAVASWLNRDNTPIPAWRGQIWHRLQTLRYGENPHQAAALFTDGSAGLAKAEQLGGKAMSYNNYVDTEAAWRAAHDFDGPTVAIIKHANPCGIATARDIATAHAHANACDPLSAFGGVIASNRPVTTKMAEQIKPIFSEVIIAPDYAPKALEILRTKKDLRILRLADVSPPALEFRQISGGILVQERDVFQSSGDDSQNWQLVSGSPADSQTLSDLEFAWRAVRSTKSNAILLAKNGASVGIGMGQVNRVDSCRLAVERANTLQDGQNRTKQAVAASDAFFPFPDGLRILIDAGVRAVVQPGGSIRDDEAIKAAQTAELTMYFTGARHFYH